MPTLREFFIGEAADLLRQLGNAVQRLDSGAGEPAELQRQSKGLRGTAQIAREDRVYKATVGLESAARAVASGAMAWGEDVSKRMKSTLEDIDALIRGGEPEDAADARVRGVLDRWREAGVSMPDEQSPQATQQVSEATRQFRQFAAHEVSGIVTEIDTQLELLVSEPRNREPLKAILRRERALLGAARIDELPVVAEAMRTVEDITRIIAKLNVPVKDDWLAAFRAAREALNGTIESLKKGEVPPVSAGASKLRMIRQQLMERYGEAASAAPAPAPPAPSAPAAPFPQPAPPPAAAPAARAPGPAPQSVPAPTPTPAPAIDEEVPIDHFVYKGDKALKRALEFQNELLAGASGITRDRLEEVFDLIRLATN